MPTYRYITPPFDSRPDATHVQLLQLGFAEVSLPIVPQLSSIVWVPVERIRGKGFADDVWLLFVCYMPPLMLKWFENCGLLVMPESGVSFVVGVWEFAVRVRRSRLFFPSKAACGLLKMSGIVVLWLLFVFPHEEPISGSKQSTAARQWRLSRLRQWPLVPSRAVPWRLAPRRSVIFVHNIPHWLNCLVFPWRLRKHKIGRFGRRRWLLLPPTRGLASPSSPRPPPFNRIKG